VCVCVMERHMCVCPLRGSLSIESSIGNEKGFDLRGSLYVYGCDLRGSLYVYGCDLRGSLSIESSIGNEKGERCICVCVLFKEMCVLFKEMCVCFKEMCVGVL